MKGIVLAGGTGSRLWPLTIHISKQLLPIYDKPLIYYPISTLMLAGIREILVIVRPEERDMFFKLLGDGADWGITIEYATQEFPKGLAESLIIGENFLDGEEVCLILGDNIFYGPGLGKQLSAIRKVIGAHVFGYRVSNPKDYGVAVIDSEGQISKIIEKPEEFVSNFAIPGVYFYSNMACSIAKQLTPSERGELEISDLNNYFISKKTMNYTQLGRGTFWMDTGSFDNLASASSFVSIVQNRQGLRVGSPEEVAYANGWIDNRQYHQLVMKYSKSGYLKPI
jgi:glucose-1-phosphate thymidylyltransferase